MTQSAIKSSFSTRKQPETQTKKSAKKQKTAPDSRSSSPLTYIVFSKFF